ncbi:MAG: STAS domain-containing protein [Lentisphaeria bacterium]|nr:STAS domain-containing protein [Lentisphaeria bacterium]
MSGIDVSVELENSVAWLKLSGRVTLEFGEQLKAVGQFFLNNGAKSLRIEMSECIFMDSTIMGVLAMVALEGYKRDVAVESVNTTREAEELLTVLGVHKVIKFVLADVPSVSWRSADEIMEVAMNSSVILDAHKTLMDVSDENISKFSAVVKCLENELK